MILRRWIRIFQALFVITTISSLIGSSYAISMPYLAIEFGDPTLHTKNVVVGSEFQVQISIRNFAQPLKMVSFAFDVLWDPSMIQYVSTEVTPLTGWTVIFDDTKVNLGILDEVGGFEGPTNVDHVWLIITFRCLGPGDSDISFDQSSWLEFESGFTANFEEVKGTVRQTSEAYPVGGTIDSSDKTMMPAAPIAAIMLIGVLFCLAGKKREKKESSTDRRR